MCLLTLLEIVSTGDEDVKFQTDDLVADVFPGDAEPQAFGFYQTCVLWYRHDSYMNRSSLFN